ncbi:MAG: hypothetical protein RL653_6 [Pseudomonadota bacterium]
MKPFLLSMLLWMPLAAHAQEGGRPARTAQSEAWGLYEQAFADAAAGRDDMALLGLEELVRRFPGTGAALVGTELRRLVTGRKTGSPEAMSGPLKARLEELAPPARAPAPSVASAAAAAAPVEKKRYASLAEALRDEQPNNGARAELVLAQTLHGLTLGLETCFALNGCSTTQALAGASLLGSAAGAGLALLYSRDGVTAGQALAINSGTAWGAWNTAILLSLAGGELTGNSILGLMAAGQVVGTVAGHFAWAGLDLAAGDVALMNSVGLYAGMTTVLTLIAAGGGQFGATAVTGVLLAATDVGLVAGYLVSRQYPLGRGRVLVMDAGALLGGLLGSSVVFLATFNGQAAAVGAIAGGLGGIAAGLHITRNLDLEWAGLPVQVGLMPTQYGGGGLAVTGRF